VSQSARGSSSYVWDPIQPLSQPVSATGIAWEWGLDVPLTLNLGMGAGGRLLLAHPECGAGSGGPRVRRPTWGRLPRFCRSSWRRRCAWPSTTSAGCAARRPPRGSPWRCSSLTCAASPSTASSGAPAARTRRSCCATAGACASEGRAACGGGHARLCRRPSHVGV
jgi:hypothetical protein